MNSIVVSPFWQSVDEQWIGATLVAISVMILVSTALFVVRSRSFSMFLIVAGFVFLAAMLLAPVADSRSPKMFQLWLMSPATLSGLSLVQILLSSFTVFGSIRQESCPERAGKLLHEIRGWLIAILAVLPSPVLIVFIFWIEQNMMISTRQTMPTMIGLQVAAVTTVVLAMLVFVFSQLDRFRLISFHFFIGLFLVLTGALLPCLTVKLSFASATDASLYMPNSFGVVLLLLAMVGVVGYGIRAARLKRKRLL